jgi:hypothetical protein
LISRIITRNKKGRPRKAMEHAINVGDMFIIVWQQLHSVITERNNGLNFRANKWIIIASAEIEEDLMY